MVSYNDSTYDNNTLVDTMDTHGYIVINSIIIDIDTSNLLISAINNTFKKMHNEFENICDYRTLFTNNGVFIGYILKTKKEKTYSSVVINNRIFLNKKINKPICIEDKQNNDKLAKLQKKSSIKHKWIDHSFDHSLDMAEKIKCNTKTKNRKNNSKIRRGKNQKKYHKKNYTNKHEHHLQYLTSDYDCIVYDPYSENISITHSGDNSYTIDFSDPFIYCSGV